jgi:hypothetical protein
VSWTPCPKDPKSRALRLIVQTPNPDTHTATNVPVAFVLCGHVEWRNGRPSVVVGKGEHGLVAVPPVAWRQRQALAARHSAATHPKGSRGHAKPAKAAKGAKPKAVRSGASTRPRGAAKAKGG